MLQQTRVATVLPFYHSFLAQFPTPAALARSPDHRVLAAWSGLGYYRRARQLRKAVRLVIRDHAGRVPDDREAFSALPGVGRYTAGAVLSIAFDLPLPVLDGNVARVMSRLLAVPWRVKSGAGSKALWDAAEKLVPARGAGEWNQALMELGATVCAARSPSCPACPVRSLCAAYAMGRVSEYPPPAARRTPLRIRRAIALIERGGSLLMAPRAGKVLNGLWEPPGADLVAASSARASLRKELARLGVHARFEPLGFELRHSITHHEITVELWRGSLLGAVPRGWRARFVDPARPRVPLTALARRAARRLSQG